MDKTSIGLHQDTKKGNNQPHLQQNIKNFWTNDKLLKNYATTDMTSENTCKKSKSLQARKGKTNGPKKGKKIAVQMKAYWSKENLRTNTY